MEEGSSLLCHGRYYSAGGVSDVCLAKAYAMIVRSAPFLDISLHNLILETVWAVPLPPYVRVHSLSGSVPWIMIGKSPAAMTENDVRSFFIVFPLEIEQVLDLHRADEILVLQCIH